MSTTPAYVLDNHHPASTEHHALLAAALNPASQTRLVSLPQWPTVTTVLEVGAGAGAMSTWLAGRVASVVAADLKPDLIPAMDNLVPVQVDLTDGQPLAPRLGSGYDLIYSRMTLQHLPNRDKLVPQLAELLNPGGVLVVEDWLVREPDEHYVDQVPTEADRDLFARYRHAAAKVFDTAGVDRSWARRCHRVMREAGLEQVDTRYSGAYWTGGSAGMRLLGTLAAQVGPKLTANGLTDDDLVRLLRLADDPTVVVEGHPLYSTSGVRPS